MLRVDLRDLSRGGWIIAILAIAAAIAVVAVLIGTGLLRPLGRGEAAVCAFSSLAAAWLVFGAGSLLLKQLGVPILRPKSPYGPSFHEAAAQLARRVADYRRLQRSFKWLLISGLGFAVLLAAGSLLMDNPNNRIPQLVVISAALVCLFVLIVLLTLVRFRIILWLCPWCGREFGRHSPFESGPHKCQHCGHAIDVA
jgi:hypothetical protein